MLMTRLNALIAFVLVLCALSLVSSQYQARRLIGDLELAQNEQRQLDTVWNQLQLDQASLSKHQLIDAAARRDLGMQPATPSRTEYITLSHDALHAAASQLETAK
jgi:cell division protein FtsL